MSKHSHISAIFDNAFQSRAGSPDVYMSMILTHTNDIYTLSSQSCIKDLIKPTTFNYNGILDLRSFDPINMIVFVKYF